MSNIKKNYVNSIRCFFNGVMYSLKIIKKCENKETLAGYAVIIVAELYALSNLIRIVISVISQRNSYINMSAASILAVVLLQIAAFVALTHYDY